MEWRFGGGGGGVVVGGVWGADLEKEEVVLLVLVMMMMVVFGLKGPGVGWVCPITRSLRNISVSQQPAGRPNLGQTSWLLSESE